MSTWNSTLPADTSKIRLSANYIRLNWTAIDNGATGTGTGFTRNHVTMNDATNGGLHYRCDFYQSVASPALAGVASFYPRTVTNTEAFFKNSVADMQITNSALIPSNGEGMLPGGLQIRCGISTFATAGTSVTFSTEFPTACISVVATTTTLIPETVAIRNLSKTGFTGYTTPDTGTAYYIAIGY